MTTITLTAETEINAPIAKVWELWNNPEILNSGILPLLTGIPPTLKTTCAPAAAFCTLWK